MFLSLRHTPVGPPLHSGSTGSLHGGQRSLERWCQGLVALFFLTISSAQSARVVRPFVLASVSFLRYAHTVPVLSSRHLLSPHPARIRGLGCAGRTCRPLVGIWCEIRKLVGNQWPRLAYGALAISATRLRKAPYSEFPPGNTVCCLPHCRIPGAQQRDSCLPSKQTLIPPSPLFPWRGRPWQRSQLGTALMPHRGACAARTGSSPL